mmetsp:Transcript_20519/g.61850  ORF Transcript_20519/g.61850 Transcript_20519/m.61850 type:complete len:218 (+) Transcript_20519:457-1110(+)
MKCLQMRSASSGIACLFVKDEGFARQRISSLSLSAKRVFSSAAPSSAEWPDSDGEPTSSGRLGLAAPGTPPFTCRAPGRLPPRAPPGGAAWREEGGVGLPLARARAEGRRSRSAVGAGADAAVASGGGRRTRRRTSGAATPAADACAGSPAADAGAGGASAASSSSTRASSFALSSSAFLRFSQAPRCCAASSSILSSSSTISLRTSPSLSPSSFTR